MALRFFYTHPRIRVKLPGCNSEYFELGRGTRQGCLLSPLLFALVIEPLARSITLNQDIKGYVKGDQHFKSSMYADNVLLLLTDPLISLLNFISTLHTLQDLTSLGVNLAKCKALSINLPSSLTERLKDNFHFAWCEGSLLYLGIRLAPLLQLIYQTNYPAAFALNIA